MKKRFLSLVLLTSLMAVGVMRTFAGENESKGERIIMSGFSFKDSVINHMIDADWATIDSLHYGNLVIPREINKIPLSAFPDNALKVCKKLKEAGYEAYMVGGAVRDLLMGIDADDADILTNAQVDELKIIFGNDLLTHKVGEATFCIVKIDGDVVDLSPMQPCPQIYIDKGLLKPIPFKTRLADSFERDLPFNAIYYEPFSGNLYDYHGGLKDIRDNTIHTMLDPSLLSVNPGATVVRLLRFQVKYNATLDPKLDSVLLADAPRLQSECAKNALYSNSSKLFQGNYGVKCYNQLVKYRIFDSVYPATKIIKNQKAYKKWLLNKLAENDSIANNGGELTRPYAMACITYPVYKQLRKKLNSDEATKQVLDMQKKAMDIWEDKKIQNFYEQFYAEETNNK